MLGAINHAHAAAPDFLQDLVVTKSPVRIRHVGFGEHTLENLRRSFPVRVESFFEKTI